MAPGCAHLGWARSEETAHRRGNRPPSPVVTHSDGTLRHTSVVLRPLEAHRLALVCLLVLSAVRGSAGLQCYVSIDSPCETFKGYDGGCVQDIGVAVECPAQYNGACKTEFRSAEPAYYFFNKSCAASCDPSTAEETLEDGDRVLYTTVDCCAQDLCNFINRPSAALRALARAPWAWLLGLTGAVCSFVIF